MIINPQERRKERVAAGQSEDPTIGEGPPKVRMEQKAPGAIVGWEHFESSVKGTPGVMVRFVVLEGADAGRFTERNFWKTPAAIGQLADLILALGHNEMVDPDNDDHLEAAFSKGAVVLDIESEVWTKDGVERTKYQPAWFGKYSGDPGASWNDLVETGEAGWENYIKWRANNPRKKPGDDDSSGQRRKDRFASGGGGYGGGAGNPDDDVPF